MASEQRFEFKVRESFEKRFWSPNIDEYFVKYDYLQGDYGRFTIKTKNDVSVFIKVKLYTQMKGKSEQSQSNVVQEQLSIFKLDVYNYRSYSTLICSIKIIPYEAWENTPNVNKSVSIQNPTTKSSSKGVITEKKLDQLSSDMRRLFTQCDLSDITLTDGSSDIRAHKLVLFARSPVFAKMFQHSMKESQENRVTITDISSEVLKEMLSYMYTGIVTLKNMKMARDLYVAADKYDIKELKSVCSQQLKDVDLDNVLDTLALADLYEDKALKQSALEYIARNYSQVKVHKTWGSFMKEHQVLAIEILSFVLDKKI